MSIGLIVLAVVICCIVCYIIVKQSNSSTIQKNKTENQSSHNQLTTENGNNATKAPSFRDEMRQKANNRVVPTIKEQRDNPLSNRVYSQFADAVANKVKDGMEKRVARKVVLQKRSGGYHYYCPVAVCFDVSPKYGGSFSVIADEWISFKYGDGHVSDSFVIIKTAYWEDLKISLQLLYDRLKPMGFDSRIFEEATSELFPSFYISASTGEDTIRDLKERYHNRPFCSYLMFTVTINCDAQGRIN